MDSHSYLLEKSSLTFRCCQNCSPTSCVDMLKRFSQYGAPKQVSLGKSSVFTSKEVKEFIALYGIKWSYNIVETP